MTQLPESKGVMMAALMACWMDGYASAFNATIRLSCPGQTDEATEDLTRSMIDRMRGEKETFTRVGARIDAILDTINATAQAPARRPRKPRKPRSKSKSTNKQAVIIDTEES